MDYIGSKEKLNEWIFSIILKDKNHENLTFLDACSGSGSVSKYAAQLNFKKVISNDLLSFPQHIIFGATSLTPEQFNKIDELIEILNKVPEKDGFFFQNYSEQSGKLYFTDENAKKIDGIRQKINDIKNPAIKSYAIYCLLEAMSSVSNTTGVQAAFLKKIKNRAKKPIKIKKMPCLCIPDKIEIYNSNILDLLINSDFRSKHKENILYIDPPYNERQYAPNYHLYETLSKDDNPVIYGKTGLRPWQNEKSLFCSKKTCVDFIKSVVNNTTADFIYISYSSDGLLKLDDFPFKEKIVHSKSQKRYKSDSNRKNNETDLFEYLIEIRK